MFHFLSSLWRPTKLKDKEMYEEQGHERYHERLGGFYELTLCNYSFETKDLIDSR